MARTVAEVRFPMIRTNYANSTMLGEQVSSAGAAGAGGLRA